MGLDEASSGVMATLEVSQVYREHFAFVWRILRRLGIPLDALEDTARGAGGFGHTGT